MRGNSLFAQLDIYSVLRNQEEAAKKRIESIPPNQLLSASEHDLIASLDTEFELHVPVIRDEEIHIADSGETQVDVSHDPMRMISDRSRPFYIPGNRTVIGVPFEGDAEFFKVRPQTHNLNSPQAEVTVSELRLTYVRTDHDAQAIKTGYQRTVSEIKAHLASLAESVKQFNASLPGLVTQQVQKRKARLLADAGMTAALGLPLKKREGAPTTYTVPVKRRVPRIEELGANSVQFKPEPTLATEDYEEILSIMKNMVQVMEQSPHAFEAMGEEDLRSHFLVQLNAQFAGQATGETFNFGGKTDILIRVEGRNVFIAECKFWKGEKSFLATIDQLLSYLGWRDTKAAVIIFNRNANFTSVLAKISECTPRHPNFKREVGRMGESTFRYIFAQPNDPSREIILTVLAFDIPTTSLQPPADIA